MSRTRLKTIIDNEVSQASGATINDCSAFLDDKGYVFAVAELSSLNNKKLQLITIHCIVYNGSGELITKLHDNYLPFGVHQSFSGTIDITEFNETPLSVKFFLTAGTH